MRRHHLPVRPLRLPVAANPDGEVERIDHLGVASADNDEVDDVFARKLGWPVESRQTDVEISTKTESFTSDKYGVVYRNHQPEFIGGCAAPSSPSATWSWSSCKT